MGRPDRPTCALGIPMIGKYGPLEISSWFRSGLNQTGAKPSLKFGGGHQVEVDVDVSARATRRRRRVVDVDVLANE